MSQNIKTLLTNVLKSNDYQHYQDEMKQVMDSFTAQHQSIMKFDSDVKAMKAKQESSSIKFSGQ